MNKKPTLSPTKITTYLACPVKYMWSFVDARGKWFLRAKSYYSFGISLHQVLQRFHDEGDVGVQTKEEVLAALEENWLTAGYSSPEEATEALAEGRAVVSSYVDEFIARGPSTKTLFVEKRFEEDMGEFTLIGRIDRVDEHEDGTLEIIDYKTNPTKNTENIQARLSEVDVLNDIAMNCYQLLLRSKNPNRRILSTLVLLNTNHRITVEPRIEDLELFRTDLILLGKEILNRDYESVRPVVKDICKSCDFVSLCQRDEEFSESFKPFASYR
ncbi:MAG TPA: PD-(D/E)XK nuclease family protein [Fimbriimonadales bacterium]|nr:PD-(D/E)XK nuclease family protein [Fimbriimonadales bacterium]